MTANDASRTGETVLPLATHMVEKVWGREHLPAPFAAPPGKRIGEIWFAPPAEYADLLVKYLFTSEKLSVQVHPSNADAMSGEHGKEECWFVLDAEPGAQLAIGFTRAVSAVEIEAAALDGTIEELLAWHDVAVGDVFYLPAGTVHAIGPGLSLVEVQQNSDTTFRLYDYGRPRELHLERAMAVAQGTPYAHEHRGSVASRGEVLIDGAYFRLDRIEGVPSAPTAAAYSDGVLALPLSGQIQAHAVQDTNTPITASAGECLYAPTIDALDFSDAGTTLLTRSV